MTWLKILTAHLLALVIAQATLAGEFQQPQNLNDIPSDLIVPKVTTDEPAAGKRVQDRPSTESSTGTHYLLYLPSDWKPDGHYPVIVEYPGRGGFSNQYGDHCDGSLEGCKLGYGLSGGKGMIWITLPFLDAKTPIHQVREWGAPETTAAYCRAAVKHVCARWGGDSKAVILTGFSRGSLACGTVGLHDDETAGLWRGILGHSHFDGVRTWNYPHSDRPSAMARLARLGNRPLFISQEVSTDDIRRYLDEVKPAVHAQLLTLPYPNHTDEWVLKDIPERATARKWLQGVLEH